MADKVVEVPGVGNVAFPDSMSDDEISLHVRKSLAGQNTPAPVDKGWFDKTVNAVGDFFGGANATGNPVSAENRAGNAQLVSHPVDSLKGMMNAQGNLATEAGKSFSQGDYLTGVRHAISYLIPFLGPAIDEAGNKAGNGQLARGLGEAAGIATPLALGAKPAAPVSPAAAATDVSPMASRLYQKALGLRKDTPIAEGRSLASTAVKSELPITEEGAQKLQQLIEGLQTKTEQAIRPAAQAGMTVNRDQAAAQGRSVLSRFDTVTSKSSSKPGLRVVDEFEKENPSDIPVDIAQQKKINTYREVAQDFGKMAGSEVETKKAIAHSLMEQIAQKIPEVADLNAKQSKLLDLQPALEKAVNRTANGTSNFKDILVTIAGHGTGVPGLGLAAGVASRVMRDPAFRSQLAIAINQAQQNNPAKWGVPSMKSAFARVNAYADALDQASKTQPANPQ